MEWKPIEDFDGYEISSAGHVRRNGRTLKPFDNGGYARIAMKRNDGKQVKWLVHRLVATYFIPTEDYSLQVNHKDTNKRNNDASNLEWVTNKENVEHAIKYLPHRAEQLKSAMSVIGKKHGYANAMKTRKAVAQCDLEGNVLKVFASARDASRELGISYKVISKCCNGQSKTYKGFTWKFVQQGKV